MDDDDGIRNLLKDYLSKNDYMVSTAENAQKAKSKIEYIKFDMIILDVMMPGKIWFNGNTVEWKDANIHILNHGLHYASCVFEGERVYDGEIFKLEEQSAKFQE